MNQNRKFGAFSSSADPSQLSLTVESVVKLLGLIAGTYLSIKGSHVVITNEVEQQTTDAFVAVITAGMAAWQSANLLFGIFRKMVSTPTTPTV